MCGRYTYRLTWKQIHDLYRITEPWIGPGQGETDLKPRFNLAPTQTAPIIRSAANGGRELALLRWGLVPSWAKDAKSGYRAINARAETVANTPLFRTAFKRRRCLIPADGFYEWKAVSGGKQPYHIAMADGAPFAFAGLWERWDGGDEPLECYAIITCAPNALCAPIHNRMPVILDPDNHHAWLSSPDTAIPMALLQPYPPEKMRAYPVSKRVGSPRNDDPGLIETAQADA